MEQQPQIRRQRERSWGQNTERNQPVDNPVLQRTASSEEESDQVQRALSRRSQRSDDGQVMPTSQQRQLRRPQPGADEQTVTQQDNGRGGAPAVRLDMDLDIDIKMKAKIQGDVTLSILDGDQK